MDDSGFHTAWVNVLGQGTRLCRSDSRRKFSCIHLDFIDPSRSLIGVFRNSLISTISVRGLRSYITSHLTANADDLGVVAG